MREIDPRDCQHGQADTEQETKERLTQPVGVVPVAYKFTSPGESCAMLADDPEAQSFIQHPKSFPDVTTEPLYSAETVARLIAERDDLIGARELNRCAIKNLQKERDELQEQVKTLRTALEKIADWDASWGPYPENNKAWRAMVVVTAREAVPRALAATEPKEGDNTNG